VSSIIKLDITISKILWNQCRVEFRRIRRSSCVHLWKLYLFARAMSILFSLIANKSGQKSFHWKKSYQLYTPKENLQAEKVVLDLSAERNGNSNNSVISGNTYINMCIQINSFPTLNNDQTIQVWSKNSQLK